MDLVIRLPHLPGRDEKIGGIPLSRAPGGMAANVAVGARRLGTSCRLVGTVGDDFMGHEVLAALANEELDLSHVVVREGCATFFCVILLDESGEKALVRAEGDTFLPRPSDLSGESFEGVSHVHLIFTAPALFRRSCELARQAGATLSMDLETPDIPADDAHLREIIEAVDILLWSAQSRINVEARLGPIRASEGPMLVTTRGAGGAEVEHGAERDHVQGHPMKPVDTLGAGDAFAAAFLHAWLAERPPRDALVFANAAGALATQAYGAQAGLAREDEVERLAARTEARLA